MPVKFEQLYDQYKNMVYNVCLNYLQNSEDAEEVAQDVFVKIYKKLDSFREQASHKTWIYRIAANCCLDFIKAKKSKKRFGFITSLFHDDEYEKRELRHFDHPGVLLEQQESVEHIFECINELRDNQKTVLILCKLEKLSQKEVSETMGISTKAVESLLQRAKQNLKKKINPNRLYASSLLLVCLNAIQ